MANSVARYVQELKRRVSRSAFASPDVVEQCEYDFYSDYLLPGMIVFDVGANVGDLTMLFSRLIEGGKVHSFEASATTFGCLKARCQVDHRFNVVLNHLAVSEREGTVQLHTYDDAHSGWNSLARRPLDKYGISLKPVRLEDVSATTVDAYCENQSIDKIDLLKIDVEGAELQVLRGARRMLLARRIKCCAFEFGQATFDMGNDPEELEAYMTDTGYQVHNVVSGDPVFPGREGPMTARFSMHIATPIP